MHRRAGWRAPRAQHVVALLLLALAPGSAHADPLAWLPQDVRVLVEIDPQASRRQPAVGFALGLDDLFERLIARGLPDEERRHQTVAFVSQGGAVHPVAFTVGTRALGEALRSLRGAPLETIGGKSLHASRTGGDWTLALIEPDCMIEGPRQTVRALLDHAARKLPTLADVPAARPTRRLVALTPGADTAISLFYFAPEGGKGVYAMLQDLDLTLGTTLSAAVAGYQSALGVLGNTHGGRLDVTQQGADLAAVLRLVMTSDAAANLASITLQAGKDMARMASEGAVRSGDLTAADARMLAGALETLQTQADKDWLHVRLRIPEVVDPRGTR